ncbi:methyltransferase domain-containing protein [Dichomitus squalens]|nr:methyltransferase domain-containing protein [Dichomitus squalens]
MADSLASVIDQLTSISHFLSQPLVSTLFHYHPNNLGQSSFDPPPEWEGWWDWAGGECEAEVGTELDDPWLLLLKYYNSRVSGHECSDKTSSVPPILRSLINDACRLALPRDIGHVYPDGRCSITQLPNDLKSQALPGMSPKKAHEVVQMVGFLETLLSFQSSLGSLNHVVDIGAGQAYVSRMLRDRLNLHVLALDWSEVQKRGASRKDASKIARRARPTQREVVNADTASPASDTRRTALGPKAGSMTYVTTRIDADSLVSATDAWVEDRQAVISNNDATPEVTPVLFIGLHACGSLTTDIIRAFLSARRAGTSLRSTSWMPHGAVIVGCCYNLMRSEDFPLSRTVRSCSPDSVTFCLSPSHLQLAAQVPSQWLRSQQSLGSARLAMRKIAWRALLEDHLQETQDDVGHERLGSEANDGGTAEMHRNCRKRLGRLNDQVFANWETFADVVRTKLHLQLADWSRPPSRVEKRIEVMHMLRCIVGPVVEAYILLDRFAWISEELKGTPMAVELVNLFDQASGSGRNVAIVIHPS